MILHASCVAHRGRGLLILGASGAGKSTLAFEMMGFGATLVSDDRTVLRRDGAALLADAPDSLRGLIEARGIGILRARAHGPVAVALVVDLDQTEPDRLPPRCSIGLLDRDLPLVLGGGRGKLAAMLLQYLDSGPADLDLRER